LELPIEYPTYQERRVILSFTTSCIMFNNSESHNTLKHDSSEKVIDSIASFLQVELKETDPVTSRIKVENGQASDENDEHNEPTKNHVALKPKASTKSDNKASQGSRSKRKSTRPVKTQATDKIFIPESEDEAEELGEINSYDPPYEERSSRRKSTLLKTDTAAGKSNITRRDSIKLKIKPVMNPKTGNKTDTNKKCFNHKTSDTQKINLKTKGKNKHKETESERQKNSNKSKETIKLKVKERAISTEEEAVKEENKLKVPQTPIRKVLENSKPPCPGENKDDMILFLTNQIKEAYQQKAKSKKVESGGNDDDLILCLLDQIRETCSTAPETTTVAENELPDSEVESEMEEGIDEGEPLWDSESVQEEELPEEVLLKEKEKPVKKRIFKTRKRREQFSILPDIKMKRKYRERMKRLPEERLNCQKCGKEFLYVGKLERHLRVTHSVGRPFTCEFCGKQFDHMAPKLIHVRVHTGEKPFQCEQCGRQFTQKGSLVEHKLLHADQRVAYFCESCGTKFYNRQAYKRHKRKKPLKQ